MWRPSVSARSPPQAHGELAAIREVEEAAAAASSAATAGAAGGGAAKRTPWCPSPEETAREMVWKTRMIGSIHAFGSVRLDGRIVQL